jgi:hypothetical protein
MEENHKGLADYLLKGELLSDSWLPNSFLQKWQNWLRFRKFLNWLNHWRHASAIRPDEIFDAIHRIAIGKEPTNETLRNNLPASAVISAILSANAGAALCRCSAIVNAFPARCSNASICISKSLPWNTVT